MKKIPKCDVLISHGPPENILDTNLDGEHLGCDELMEIVTKIKPKYHIFGHIHPSSPERIVTIGDTTFVNASVLDEGYVVSYPPIVLEI
jgi:Icc-related predicted phosphoesterase